MSEMTPAPVKVRFAPSPTGFLHVGGARTLLYNWLYARRQGGQLVFRIEDTDRERSEDRYLQAIMESVKWMGLDWDEGPFYQSERLEIYREYAQKLVDQGLAQKLDDGTEAVVFPVPNEGQTIFGDMIHGKISFENADIKEQVLIKSDGYPAYSFACVLDDALMGITHVIRGDDHISNTPKQILMYQALGFKVPKFAHIPLIMGADNSRLSKRHGATSVNHYCQEGYTPEGFVNFLALLGWSPGENKELMSLDELQKNFSLKRVTGKSAIFDQDKLAWMNSQYIKSLDVSTMREQLKDILQAADLDISTKEDAWLDLLIVAFQGRVKTLKEIIPQSTYIFNDTLVFDEAAVQEHWGNDSVKVLVKEYCTILEAITDFDISQVEQVTKEFCKSKEIKMSALFIPVRVALSGQTVTPGIYEVIALLGQKETCRRLSAML